MKPIINLDTDKVENYLEDIDTARLEKRALQASEMLVNGTGRGSEFLGWIDLPVNYDKAEFQRIKETAGRIRSDSEVLIVIGIGGSYLGARAVIESLSHCFFNAKEVISKEKRPEIYFVGNNLSSSYIMDIIDLVKDKDFFVNIFSKSGTTTEPSLSFRIFRRLLINKYGEEGAAKRIYATTDKEKGALKHLADTDGYETFVVPDDVGGRYSVLSAVGLLPIAVAGINIDELMRGAADERLRIKETPFAENEALKYAAYRNVLLEKGKNVEIISNYEPNLRYISEWWKQLFGESEGKELKGVFPATAKFSTDLHSFGQYIQDGTRMMFETVIWVDDPRRELFVEEWEEDVDGLNYLAGKSFYEINYKAMMGSMLAHCDGGVPNFLIRINEISEYTLGALLYFFEYACGVSGYMLGVNPFDQPGVDEYKNNMFALLGKPGYEKAAEELRKRGIDVQIMGKAGS